MKERITGAVVLVLFVVLVVPVFLDGPPVAGETVSQRVLLPGQEGQDVKTVVLERERSVPIPAAEAITPPRQAPSETRQTGQAKEVPTDESASPAAAPVVASNDKSPPTQPEPVPTSSTTGMWAVQLGSFAVRENAEKLQASLRKQGYAAFLSQVTSGGKLQFRVRIGPQKDRAGAETTAAQLLKANHRGQVVPHP